MGCLVNPDIDLWCDAQEMETLTQQARLLPSRDARTEDMWRRAVELYQGDFLPSWDAEWVIYRREDLLEAYIEALIGLGNCARARNDLREALATYRRALDADPYREDVHRAIMICYAESGEKKQVLDHPGSRPCARRPTSIRPPRRLAGRRAADGLIFVLHAFGHFTKTAPKWRFFRSISKIVEFGKQFIAHLLVWCWHHLLHAH